MIKDTLFTRHKKLFLFMGIVESCSTLIMAISLLLLPLASYNLTKLELTKVSLNFFELIATNPLIVIGFLLLCLSVVPGVVNKILVQKDIWRAKINIMLLISIAGTLLFVVGAVIVGESTMEYTDLKTDVTVMLTNEIGAYLYWAGLIAVAIGVWQVICLKLIHLGKYSEEQLFGSVNMNERVHKNINGGNNTVKGTVGQDTLNKDINGANVGANNSNTEDKIKQLLSLKDAGIITEQEYNQKKKVLLDNLVK